MAFQDFVAQIRNRGIAKQSHFLVEITPPPFLIQDNKTTQLIPLFCEQAMFPELALASVTVKDNGLNREAVYDKLYGNLTLTFICDQQMIIKSFFDSWVKGTIVKDGGIFRYPNDYTVPLLSVYQLDASLNRVYGVGMERIYPKVVNDIVLNASGKGYSTFQVQFTYETWTSFSYNSLLPDVEDRPGRTLDIARILNMAGGLSVEGLKSAIITRGTQAITGIISSSSVTLPNIPGFGTFGGI